MPDSQLKSSPPPVADHLPNDTGDQGIGQRVETDLGLVIVGDRRLSHWTRYSCKTDPDLAAVVDAWPELPEAIKASIVAMVKAARN